MVDLITIQTEHLTNKATCNIDKKIQILQTPGSYGFINDISQKMKKTSQNARSHPLES